MNWRMDLRSKLIDGALAALILSLLTFLVVLLVNPIQGSLGRPGLLVYTLVLMAVSVFFLEHSLPTRIPEWTRAWYGMVGGLIAWLSVTMSNKLGIASIPSLTGILVLILFALTITRLWRRYLPAGARFYSITVLLAWTGELIVDSRAIITAMYAKMAVVYRLGGYAAVLGAFLAMWWIFTQTDRRIQRLSAAPLLAFFAVIAGFIFWY